MSRKTTANPLTSGFHVNTWAEREKHQIAHYASRQKSTAAVRMRGGGVSRCDDRLRHAHDEVEKKRAKSKREASVTPILMQANESNKSQSWRAR